MRLASRGLGRVEPGDKIGRTQLRKGEQQVAQIPLGIKHNGRDAVQRRLFQQANPQAGLAAAGHPHADSVGREVASFQQQRAAGFAVRPVELLAQVKSCRVFKIG